MFHNLPHEVRLQLIIHTEEREFYILKSFHELNYIFKWPYLERIYEERTKKYYSRYIIGFKENIKWEEFYKRIYQFIKKLSIYKKILDTKYLAQHNFLIEFKIYYELYPNIKIERINADKAVINNSLETLKWLISKDCYPYQKSVNTAAFLGNIQILKYLSTVNELFSQDTKILPTQTGADYAAANDQIDILIWLEKKGILPSIGGANEAAKNGRIKILNWLYDRKILPNAHGIRLAEKREQIKVIEWMKEKKIYHNGFIS